MLNNYQYNTKKIFYISDIDYLFFNKLLIFYTIYSIYMNLLLF